MSVAKVISLINDYQNDIVSGHQAIKIHPSNFSDVLVKNLSVVNSIKSNRPLSDKSSQTHLDFVGKSMAFFYPLTDFESIDKSTDDEKVNVHLLNLNLEHLTNVRDLRMDNRPSSHFKFSGEIGLIPTHTVKRISKRNNKKPQVQLSKKKLDGDYFTDFRTGLFPNDLLIFLKYKDLENTYLVVGIPSTYYENKNLQSYGISDSKATQVFRNSEIDTVMNSEFISLIEEQQKVKNDELISEQSLRSVDSSKIGTYRLKENELDELEETNNYDPTEGIKKRQLRTLRHHQIVRNIATQLEALGYKLYEDPIDILGVRGEEPSLIFEVKSLDGSFADERKQVRNALGQLQYYEEFAMNDYRNHLTVKIAVFESKITDEHLLFLQKHNCLVIWEDGKGGFDGSSEAQSFLINIGLTFQLKN